MRRRQILLASFLDGLTAPMRLFDTVERPGSDSGELDKMTTPQMLAAYAEGKPWLPAFLLDLKRREHERDVAYARLFRIVGSINLIVLIVGLCLIALKR